MSGPRSTRARRSSTSARWRPIAASGSRPPIEEAAAREFVQNGAIVSVESLGGKELDWYFREINEGVEDLSPSARVFITQIGLEPVLLDRARRSGGAEVQYASEVVDVSAGRRRGDGPHPAA